MAGVRLIVAIAPDRSNGHSLHHLPDVAIIREGERQLIESPAAQERLPRRDVGRPVCEPFLRVLRIAASTVFVLVAQVAQAQPFFRVPPQQGSSPSIRHSAAYCKQSTLSGPAFIQLLDTIIKHGDLTDVAFVERTLGVKFAMSYGWGLDGNPDPKKLDYQSDQMLGDPIHLILDIDTSRQKKGHQIEFITFQDIPTYGINGSFIVDCLHMSAYDFPSFFGKGFFTGLPAGPLPGEPVGPPASVDAMKNLDSSGKDNTSIELKFGYNTTDLTVNQISIVQHQ